MSITPLATARRTKHQRDYFVYDQYNTALPAGSVNNTQAEPVGGGRVVVDTNSKISIAGGQLDFATGAASHDGVFYGLQNRIAGRVVKAVIIRPDAAGQMGFGWAGALSGAATDRVLFAATNVLATVNTGAVVIGKSSATTYDVACIMRSTGHFYFVKGGLYDKWKPLFISQVGSTNRYGVVQAGSGTTNPFKADDFRIPKFNYIPVPLQSDGMSATTTDGLGNLNPRYRFLLIGIGIPLSRGEKWQADNGTFRKYATWRATPYVKGALSNLAIQRRPYEFITSWSDYLASSSMYGSSYNEEHRL